MKKLLMLGGSFSQVPAIKYAIETGYYVITCDYLPDNPGHKYANEYYNISTTDKEKVLDLAEKLNIDGILAFASDPSAPTAAYISEKLKLPCNNSYNSVIILSEKDKFRDFQKENGFNYPQFKICRDFNDVPGFYKSGNHKLIVKPNDSSGSKGIKFVSDNLQLKSAFMEALKFSKKKEVIIEDVIGIKGPQIHGEGFVKNGELEFILLGDQIFSPVNNCVPYSTTIPSYYHQDIMPEVIELVKKHIKLTGLQNSGLNIEVIRDINDKLFVLEIGARSGGNYMPQLEQYCSGIDLIAANVEIALGNEFDFTFQLEKNVFFTQVILHSYKNGIFKGIQLSNELKKRVIDMIYFKEPGQKVHKYRGSHDVLGILLYKDRHGNQQDIFLNKDKNHIEIIID